MGRMKNRLTFLSLGILILLTPLFSSAAGIQWLPYKDGMAKGKSEKKKIFINFYADW